MKLSCFLRLILSEGHGNISKLTTFNGAQKIVKKQNLTYTNGQIHEAAVGQYLSVQISKVFRQLTEDT